MLTDQKVIDFFTNEMVLAKINGKEDTLLTQEHHVSAFPTLVMLDNGGQEVDRIVGYLPPDKFLKTLQNYQKGIGTLDDLLNRVKATPSRPLAFQIGDKYKYRGNNDEAVKWFQKVVDDGDPRDSLSGESRLALADMRRRSKEYQEALSDFSSIMNDVKGSTFAEESEIWRAIVFRLKGDTASAITAFGDLIKHYPEPEDVTYAKKHIARLKGEPEEKKQ